MSAKYIFVTGGVVSSLGKGLAAASMGCLLESRGLKVNLMKFDPYLNVDPGTMSPSSTERYLSPTMAPRLISTSATTSASPTPSCLAITTGPLDGFTSRSSPRSGAAIISARPCRSFLTSPMKLRLP